MKSCTTVRMSFISASTPAARTNVNVMRACTLLMENAEVITSLNPCAVLLLLILCNLGGEGTFKIKLSQ